MVIGAGGAPGAASGRAAGITTGAGTGDANRWECLWLMGAGAATGGGTGTVDGEVLGAVIDGFEILRAPPAYPCIYFKISR